MHIHGIYTHICIHMFIWPECIEKPSKVEFKNCVIKRNILFIINIFLYKVIFYIYLLCVHVCVAVLWMTLEVRGQHMGIGSSPSTM